MTPRNRKGVPPPKTAVALRYQGGKDQAPVVVAAGQGLVAEKIAETARAHDVPMHEDAMLAATLSQVDVGKQIPASLYKAVAEVLAFVYRLDRQRRDERRNG
ncbi:MAG: EscU/YscU/HrcU family type III secretion system export apparatus switch protein [Planctomycetota bacterium]|nr:EscU/YscU/HrcU family type III secretion system export apparatus switch protein [Planctomycetota bacterium]